VAIPACGHSHDSGNIFQLRVKLRARCSTSLHEPGRPITAVGFPDSGVWSVLTVTHNGMSAEVATVGNEGMTGIALFFGDITEPSQSLVQVPGAGRLLPARIFKRKWRALEERSCECYAIVARYFDEFLRRLRWV
jgi:hypothetical protein